MTDKQVIIDGLFCDNCPEAQRCQEQRAKKEYAINQVLQDVPSEYANVINRLRQIIPSITRCDYVLEKQLKHKEQECKELKEANDSILTTLNVTTKGNIKLRQTLAEIQEIAKYDVYTTRSDLCLKLNWIKKKISESEVEDD